MHPTREAPVRTRRKQDPPPRPEVKRCTQKKELRRQTGHNADEKEIEHILQAEVLRPDLLA
ncbi:hypothetical protein ACIG5D_16745 [Microbispora rosea]|uniref:hypothetical protein n=1 Tax=Microbispora rosea TaxID=58117 RepID=UPI0037CC1158